MTFRPDSARSIALLLFALLSPTWPAPVGAAEAAGEPVLRILYFTPSDREPIPGYAARLDKIMEHVRQFYRDGMAAAGYGQRTFNLDRQDDGSLRIFLVRGAHPTEKYGRDSGWALQRECSEALAKEGIDLGQETALIFNNLLLWEGDKAVEHGPYAGGGSSFSGFAWAYDDALLDPDKLSSKEPGGYYHRPCSIGQFNSHYLGGIAHELGHGLGLPHVCQTQADRQRGTALMGAGNHTWGQEQRGEGPGTFLTTASAMQLSTNRLFADHLLQPQRSPSCRLEEFQTQWKDGRLTLRGRFTAEPAVYGLVLFNDDYARESDYDAVAWTTNIDDDGLFSIDVQELRPGKFQLRLMACHTSGQRTHFAVDYEVDGQGGLDPGVFHGLMLVEAARAYSAGDRARAQSIAQSILNQCAAESLAGRKARHLLALLEPRTYLPPADVPLRQNSVGLTDLEFREESVGWRRPTRDQVPVENGGMCFLEIGDQFHPRGLYAHAPSRYVVQTGKAWKHFTTCYGLQKGHPGSVVFVIRGDNRELFRSGKIGDEKPRSLDIDISGVDLLELAVENAGDGNAADWGVWLAPTLNR